MRPLSSNEHVCVGGFGGEDISKEVLYALEKFEQRPVFARLSSVFIVALIMRLANDFGGSASPQR
eukprot:11225008-Lingulodinium_polyedra.AAC.1